MMEATEIKYAIVSNDNLTIFAQANGIKFKIENADIKLSIYWWMKGIKKPLSSALDESVYQFINEESLRLN